MSKIAKLDLSISLKCRSTPISTISPSLPALDFVTPLPPTIHSFLKTSVTIITIAALGYLSR